LWVFVVFGGFCGFLLFLVVFMWTKNLIM
jgi:hypothetical protein